MRGTRIFLTASSFKISESKIGRFRVGLVRFLTSGLGRILITIRLSINRHRLIRLICSNHIIQDRRLHAIVPVDFMTIMFSKIITNYSISATLATRIASNR